MTSRSSQQQDDDVIELAAQFRGLQITIRGPSGEATEALSLITGALAGRPASAADSVGLGSVPEPSVDFSTEASFVSSSAEPRRDIPSTFEACPAGVLAGASRLSDCNGFSKRDRLLRAWTAGCWARAVLAGHLQIPVRTPQLPIRSRYYAILRAEGVDTPVIFQSSVSYWRALRGTLGDSITHSFPSETEARAYVRAAGFHHPPSFLP